MFSRIHTVLAATGILSMVFAGEAHASVVTESFSGVVAGSRTTDSFGWFGTFGTPQDLAGDILTGSYSYDSSLADFPVRNSAGDSYIGEGTNAGAFTVSISINGHGYTVGSSQQGQAETSSNDGTIPGTYELYVNAANSSNDLYYTLFGGAEWVAGANPALIDSPISLTTGEQQFGLSNASNYFSEVLSFDVTPADTSVPEPASIGMFLAGLLGMGGTRLRRRR